eukprot:3570313-Alexandrium_andersonii.AAC.1
MGALAGRGKHEGSEEHHARILTSTRPPGSGRPPHARARLRIPGQLGGCLPLRAPRSERAS